MSLAKVFVSVFATILICFGIYGSLSAQSDENRHSIVTFDRPLEEAIRELIQKTQIDIVFKSDLLKGKRSFCRTQEANIETLLRCILKDNQLDYYRLSTGTYVIRKSALLAPEYGSLSGQVIDEGTGSPLSSANVILADLSTGSATSPSGRYSFGKLLPGTYGVIASHVGYLRTVDTVQVSARSSTRLNLAMKAAPYFAAPIIIDGLSNPSSLFESGNKASRQEIRNVSPLASATTSFAIDQIVGVRVGNSLSEVHVQGGDIGDHEFTLDEATLFNPVHAGGFLGVMSPFALGSIELQKAGFGVSHGSHLSGLIEAKHFLSDQSEQQNEIQIDPLSLNVRHSGNKKFDSAEVSWMGASRIGLWKYIQPGNLSKQLTRWSATDYFLLEAQFLSNLADLFGGAVTDSLFFYQGGSYDEDQDEIDLGFQDYHAAVRIKSGPLKTFSASVYRGSTEIANKQLDSSGQIEPELNVLSQDQYNWTNSVAQAKYEWVQGDKTFSSVSAWRSKYRLNHPYSVSLDSLETEGELSIVDRNDVNDISEFGLRAQLDHSIGRSHFLSAGLEFRSNSTNFSLSFPAGEFANDFDPLDESGSELRRASFFLEDEIALGGNHTLVMGLLLNYLNTTQYVYAEPRISHRYHAESNSIGSIVMETNAGLYRQYLNQFDISTFHVNALLPRYRFWVPVGESYKPPKAIHLASNISWVPKTGWQLNLESYYKHQPHLLELNFSGLNLGNSFFFDNNQEQAPLLNSAKGFVYGLGIGLRRISDNGFLSAQYEFTRAKKRSSNRFDGRLTSLAWNVPHQLNLNMDRKLFSKLLLNLRCQIEIGRSWGYRQAYYDYLGDSQILSQLGSPNFSNPEDDKLPPQIRLDGGLAYAFSLGPTKFQTRLGAMNLLRRTNVTDWSLVYNEDTDSLEKVERPAFPFMPTLTLRLQW